MIKIFQKAESRLLSADVVNKKRAKENIIGGILIIAMILCVANTCFAVSTKINPDDYGPTKNPIKQSDLDAAVNKAKPIVNAITGVGIIVSIIAMMALGIKYMIGSVEQRAEYKKTMMPMIIGIILIFSVCSILQLVYPMIDTLNK